ncbi:3-hydroxyacyl-CoA dehydrogenase/enoyl-CoA hydratase family protein [Candidatus Poribacteria bacterium]|nr:3-hydroxyacyl-CoA dehydrogenase/enoyl-CoA hydratase family protein [Candidatus Poribacteria bacterium]
MSKREIKKVAVLGSGVMGSGIAAHLANAGIPSYMMDIVPKELTEEEKAKGLTTSSPAFRNRFAATGKQKLLESRPALLYSAKDAKLITVGNFEDNFDWLKEVDWIIEVVVENLKIKQELFKKVAAVRKPGTIVSSNTSGVSIEAMADGQPDEFKEHFLGTHFFNPVRYMKLLEIIPNKKTNREIVEFIADFGENVLGKGIVFGKDTPNFVANRVGVYGMMDAIRIMLEEGLTIDEVDKILGPALGRPKSAAFRTADIVGLDTFISVAGNVYNNAPGDEERNTFAIPDVLKKMLENKWLGDKTGGGFYKMIKKPEKQILSLDLKTLEYAPGQKVRYDSLKAVKDIEDVGERIKALVNSDDKAGKYAWRVLVDSLIYAANRIPEIADDIVNIDNGIKWGFNWSLGLFETWDAIGVKESVERMKKEGRKIPAIVEKVLTKGEGVFYKRSNGKVSYFDLKMEAYKELPQKSTMILLPSLKERNKIVKQNPGATLVDIGDGVICLEFHTKMNSVDDDIISMMNEGVNEVEKNFAGMVVSNHADSFSVGANLFLLMMESQQENWERINQIVKAFQDANMRLRYSAKPVVCAPFGMSLGGGCEIPMGADMIRAYGELYIGLVEVGVGIIPGGGGTKEMLLRGQAIAKAKGPFAPLQIAFETIAFAKVSTSAKEAMDMGILRASDKITLGRDRLIYDAKQDVLDLAKGYVRPTPREDIRVAGSGGRLVIEQTLEGFKLLKRISDHDETIGKKLAYVLSGGEAQPVRPVTEQYLLDLEREAFLSLCGMKKSQERMQHMLMTGKPLRN